MGIASLLAPPLRGRARIVHVGEYNADYVKMIESNHAFFARNIGHPEQVPRAVVPADATSRASLTRLDEISRKNGGVTLLLAGPPCQGFSNSNKMSRQDTNPLNLLALDTVQCISAASPLIAIIENVPGIRSITSARSPNLTVSEHIERKLRKIGYSVRTILLDAADYGVPQHRIRSFTVAVTEALSDHIDLGDLVPPARFGPDRKNPYCTVRDALSDLPRLDNGAMDVVGSYPKQPMTTYQKEVRRHADGLYDHVTTRHAPYVLERYKAIPQGANWRAIRRRLSNYSNPDNTHTNIYRRLHPDEPSITIGNFRKAMTIHPFEDRGLSLREAARLQSLPDWMRFFPDNPEIYHGHLRGLGLRQQQVGNAVCFRLTSELVSHLFADA